MRFPSFGVPNPLERRNRLRLQKLFRPYIRGGQTDANVTIQVRRPEHRGEMSDSETLMARDGL